MASEQDSSLASLGLESEEALLSINAEFFCPDQVRARIQSDRQEASDTIGKKCSALLAVGEAMDGYDLTTIQ